MSPVLVEPNREQILQTVERIERSKGFRRSLRMTRLLRFVVEAAIDGRIDDLREIVIGIEVFDRGDSFDPATDNIVRVDAARLRTKLAGYYANEGANESIRISMPKGGYVPQFETVAARGVSSAKPLCERGFRHLRRRTAAEIAKAVSVFEAALAEDPAYGSAMDGLAASRLALAEMGYGPADALLEKAAAHARAAAKIDDSSSSPLVTLGTIELLRWRVGVAQELARRAMRLAPEASQPRTLLGRALVLRGDDEEALEELERAVALDPNDERARQALGWELCLQGDCEGALQQAQAAAYFEPGLHGPHVLAAAAHISDGLLEDALGEIQQAEVRAPENPWTLALQAYVLGRLGQTQEAIDAIAALARRAGAGELSPICLAAARLGLEQISEAQADTEAALAARDPQIEMLRLSLFAPLGKLPLPLS
jgi:Flp pilus assembly protein TadD